MSTKKPEVVLEDAEAAEAREAAEAQAAGKVQMEMVAIAIKRDANNVIHTEVLPDEVPIMYFLHTEENVTVKDDAEVGTVWVDPNAETEFARLLAKFTNKDEEIVRAVFPRGASDLREFGFTTSGKSAVKPPSAVVQASGKKKASSKK